MGFRSGRSALKKWLGWTFFVDGVIYPYFIHGVVMSIGVKSVSLHFSPRGGDGV